MGCLEMCIGPEIPCILSKFWVRDMGPIFGGFGHLAGRRIIIKYSTDIHYQYYH